MTFDEALTVVQISLTAVAAAFGTFFYYSIKHRLENDGFAKHSEVNAHFYRKEQVEEKIKEVTKNAEKRLGVLEAKVDAEIKLIKAEYVSERLLNLLIDPMKQELGKMNKAIEGISDNLNNILSKIGGIIK